jgi:hypothetical protein
MNEQRRPLRGKKLLVAAIGVGVIRLVGCHGGVSGNLVAPPCDGGNRPPYCNGPGDMTPPTDMGRMD